MSLITRCPACGTMFKVVADQLKVSQGWVRCGHCAEVFDAATHLLPRESASLKPARLELADLMPAPLAPDADEQEVTLASPLQESAETQLPQRAVGEPESALADLVLLKPALPEANDAPDSAGDFDPARWKLALHEGTREQFREQDQKQEQDKNQEQEVQSAWDPSAASSDLPPRLQELVHTAAQDEAALASQVAVQAHDPDLESSEFDALSDVSFVRDARRKAFWTQPLVRRSLAALSVLLLTLLALQWTVQQKDSLAARNARLGPMLQTLCSALGCGTPPLRHIESLVIDSSSFNRLAPDAFRLNFSLKNTAEATLEIPSLEVTLTDAQDRALVRRVLAPALFGAGSNALAAHSELAGAVTMKISAEGSFANDTSSPSSASAAPLRVAGYRVLAFYP
jgi:predicted Zn finger-like uncharacterized protein